MKYIKQYENTPNDYKYEIGDYVLLRNKVTSLDEEKFKLYKNYGIVRYRVRGQINRKDTPLYDINYIDYIDYKLKNITQIYIAEYDIKRKLNESEIEDFKLKLDQNKYNL